MKLCLVGGFLGSGKTTAIATAGSELLKDKISVAAVMNDQGSQLVDGAFTRNLNLPVGEVKNGCFCCNYEQFNSVINDLNTAAHPEIIFAEAVGSCADLVSTIIKPMRRFNAEIEVMLSVFADGAVLLSSLEGRSSFVSEDVQYIYKKQLEEAQILIVNKSDTLNKDDISKIKTVLKSEYPGKKLLFQNSRSETSVKKWLDIIKKGSLKKPFTSLNIDYEKYAAGEAALTWLDAFVTIHSKQKAIEKSYEFIDSIVNATSARELPIGHLKFFLQSKDLQEKISFTAGKLPDKKNRTANPGTDHATVVVNARVETDPVKLKEIFFQAIRKTENKNCYVEVLNLASFQPGYPRPTYRVVE
jgi:G3E family GTPase